MGAVLVGTCGAWTSSVLSSCQSWFRPKRLVHRTWTAWRIAGERVMIASQDANPEIEGRLVRVLAAARLRLAGGGLRLAMLLSAAYIYVLRQPSVLMTPTFWAEDGTVFFKGALENGLGAIFQPYNGQLFLFQRLVAMLAALLPASITPAIYAVVAVAAAVLSCSIALSSRWRYEVPLVARFLCVLALLSSRPSMKPSEGS